MVYCGKPSKGCKYCRQKRLKCDQKRPGCSQCRHASRACPGYRNELDLMFRDESNRVHQKYQVAPADHSDTYLPCSSSLNPSTRSSSSLSLTHPEFGVAEQKSQVCTQDSNSTEVLCLSYPRLSLPLSDLATSFFMAQYIPGSHFDYIPLLLQTSYHDSLLSTVIRAVSIASLSHETRKPELMVLARQQYSQSLTETNLALQRPDASYRDEILASILLLAHFETLASEDSIESPNNDDGNGKGNALTQTPSNYSPSATWARHINGAFTLLQLRANSDTGSPVNPRLCHHLLDTVRGHCVQHHTRFPPSIHTLDFTDDIYINQRDPKRRFALLLESYAEFRAAIGEGSLSDPTEILRRGLCLDEQAIALSRDLHSPPWAYDIITTTTQAVDGVYKGKYHLYPDPRAAQRWNTIRMTRISVNGIMYTLCKGGDFTDQRAQCTQTIDRMATEICQSSSQFLTTPGSLVGASQSTRTVASAYFLIWPLFVSAISTPACASIRAFVLGRLEFIEREMRIPQAKRAARMLEQGDEKEDWMHMMHLF